jgi:excisionase family DNA binding protein
MKRKFPSNQSHIDSKKRIEVSTPEAEPLWTVKEVARYLRIKPETVRAMARRGDLPVVKVGRMWRFKRNLIEKWLQECSENPID